MPSLLRRSLVLATLLALLLGVVGVSAPAALAAKDTSTRVAGINVDATTIPQLQALMNRHRLSSVQLVQFYLHRITTLNPKLHAVITVNPSALALARAADKARRFGDHRPLLGIPVLVKDNVNTTGMPTTAGSWALAGSHPSDAFIAQRLKAAGAIIIGKANLSEWANFRSNPSSSGWSGIGGQTNMPYVLDRNPCGSSSGTGSGVAADLATVGIGTETDGSIVCPAGANGIVGLKPTIGLWSRAGVIPISADQDTAGPMTRNVTDAAVVLGAVAGIDPNDPATAAQAGHAFTDYTQFLDAHALEGKRIGIWRAGTYSPATEGIALPILADVIDVLEAQGATVVDPTDIDLSAAIANEFPALLCEFKTDIATYLQTYTAAGYPKTLADLIAFNTAHPELEGPWNSALWKDAEATGGRSDPACQAARAATTAPTQAAVDGIMAANNLDAIVGLTNGPAWVTSDDPERGDLEGTDDFALFMGNSTASAVSGYGTITVPAAYVGHLPIGISFIGGRWSEPELIGFAYDYEQATHVRIPPTFLAHETASAAAAGSAAGHGHQKAVAPGRKDHRVMMPAR
ncbi:MAG TPA: amidase [Candidatus Limnocylindrales bacterium]|nr:amidase [Candidatus Limnocylindrales bacterium]